MRTVVLASLRTHTRRYLAAGLAIAIAVAFVVVINALSSATRDGMVAGVGLPYESADVVVSDIDGETADRLVRAAREQGGAAAVLGWTRQRVSVAGGSLHEGVDVGALADESTHRWQVLEEGRFPEGRGEAVADVNAAKSSRVTIGDQVTIGSGEASVEARVVGLVDSPSATAAAALYVPWDDAATWASDFYVDSVAWDGRGSPAEQIADLEQQAGMGGATLRTRDAFVADRAAEITNGVDVLSVVLLLFAAIAVVVSVMVIANTFSILFAQRVRDFALLRCVGATRRQVVRSVRREALVLGVVASAAGVGLGVAGGYGLAAMARAAAPSAFIGSVSWSAVWLGAAVALGVGVTLVASWLPTRKVVAVSPLAALRPEQAADVRSGAGRLRIALGLALVLGGSLLLAGSIALHNAAVMIAGGAATFAGVVLLGPVVVPALVRVAGHLAGRILGAPARLATDNAVRNPRRTAATTASLLVGVTLTTAVLTGLASSRGAVDDDMATQHPIDLTVTAAEPLADDLTEGIARSPGVRTAVAVQGARASIGDGVGDLPLLAAPADAASVLQGDVDFAQPGPGELFLPYDVGDLRDGQRVSVRVGDETRRLRVVTSQGWGSAAVVASATLASFTNETSTYAVWVRATDGADPEDLAGDLEALAGPAGAEVASGLARRAYVDLQIDVLTASVVALLGIGVVIALIGIANTLGLSVLERARENALLRALGLTRRQLRATIATEALLLSVVATLLGTALGVTYAWVAVQSLVRAVVPDAPMDLPFAQLALVVIVAGAAGLVSAVLPTRRALRTSPAQGLAAE